MQTAQDFFLSLLPEATEISKDVSQRYFKKPLDQIGIQHKADASPVTAADIEIESRLRSLIEKKFPDHGIVGEESGNTKSDADFVWVLDPIDGTKSFISGVPLFTTLIALLHKGNPECGAIYQPILNELVWGNNRECFFNGNKTQIRNTAVLKDATLLITDANDMTTHHPTAQFSKLTAQTRFWRTWADGYGYALLATGYADVMLDPVMNPWDIMAVIPVVRGAGGIVSDFAGNDAAKGTSLMAAPPALHHQVKNILFS
ncbi:MAG TPA: inositol monophosphatase family protein [Turneriella sp.]|nr:inositol monophosphatase family protein [Turneriella sp.]